MLVLSRRIGERIVIGDGILVTVVATSGDRVRLGVSAPAAMPIHREEIWKRIHPSRADDRENLGGTELMRPPSKECAEAVTAEAVSPGTSAHAAGEHEAFN
jgi:carbon storage regulator